MVVELAQVVDADGDVGHGVDLLERANVEWFARQMISATSLRRAEVERPR